MSKCGSKPKRPGALTSNQLNRRIVIQKDIGTDESGYHVENWTDVMRISAAREPLRGREFFEAKSVQAENTVRYKIRCRTGIESDMRLVDLKDDRVYNIGAVLDDVYGDRTETHLMTTEQLKNG